MTIQSQPALFGVVLVGTITGQTVYQVPYSAPAGTHAAPAIAGALGTLWHALPSALAAHGEARFAFLVRQAAGDPSEPMHDIYYFSGMSAGTLFATVARKLLKVRAACPAYPAPAPRALEVTEGLDYEPSDFAPMPTAGVQRVRQQLHALIHGDPWAGLRA